MFDYEDSNGNVKAGKVVGHVLIVLAVIVLLLTSFGTVPAGFIGVRTSFGAVTGLVKPGLYVQVPFVQDIVSMDTQTQKEQVDATAASNDLQQVTATVAINFHVNPQDAGQIYQSVGADYQARVIDPAIQESIKSVTANYTAEQLITQREKAREEILALLSTKLQSFGVNTDSLNIVNFQFSYTFNTAIEAKVTAQQDAMAAQNKLIQVEAEASQTIATAEGQAEAIRIQAAAITSQGGPDYVKLQAIQKWNGTLPTYMLGNATPFVSMPSGN